MELRRRIITASLLLLAVIAISVAGYRLLGGQQVGLLQALYMAVITLAGVGYGEFVDTGGSPVLRVFNIFVVMFGVMITAYVFSAVTAFLVEGDYSNSFRRRKMLKRVAQLRNHYVVCGLGDTGRHAVTELQKTGSPYVVIDTHEETIRRFQEHAGSGFSDMLYINGDATDEDILEAAGLPHAAGLLTMVGEDKDNLVITVMVRQKNPNVRLVAKCKDLKFSERMLKAGANSVVSPNKIGGMRLASEMLRPHVVGFLDLMLKEQSRTLRIEEIPLASGSPWLGKTIGDLCLRDSFNLLPMAIKSANQQPDFRVNPPDTLQLAAGAVLIVMGDVHDIQNAKKQAASDAKGLIAHLK